MDGQTLSYNPKERNLEIDSKVPPLLETLEKKLYKMARKIREKSNINAVDRIYVNIELAYSGKDFGIYTGKLFFVNNKGEEAGKCYFIVDNFLTNDIICRTAENKYYEIRDYELRDIGEIVKDLSNIINEQENFSNSPYWLVLYADIKNINSGYPLYINSKIEKRKLLLDNIDPIAITYNNTRSDISLIFIPL